PCRIEFWGDEIDSMRAFNVDSQRSESIIDSYRITPRSHGNNLALSGNAFSYVETSSCQILEIFPREIANNSPNHLELLNQKFFQHLTFSRYREENNNSGSDSELHSVSAVMKDFLPDEITSGGMELIRKLINTQLHQYLADGYRIFIQCKNAEAEQNIREYLKLNNFKNKQFTTFIADLPCGVICPAGHWLLLTEKELFTAGVFKNFNAATHSLNDTNHDENIQLNTNHAHSEFVPDLEEGDYVVHINHGIARFCGLKTLTRNKAQREVMVLEYQDNMLLYVPIYQAAHISKYIGSGGSRITLHRLDGRKWSNDKKNASASIRAYAADLLRLQAVRQSSGALPCPEDNLNMRVFENNFAFDPTPDQRRAADEIKNDLSGPRPMDRLLCGDVGYGKTEVALRAIFKMVDAGYQVAILAPTTILAQQHFLTFQERFAEYPYTIEVLSRFKTPLEQRKIIENLKSGGVDIIIGTHRLCQDDIGFKNLGLVVIDEEQRFGVKHKERIRRFRTEAHVLTMSATPIPRTLYMAMA
ncbi:MAG: CarD family transcriptional regulator, partial [Victivallaceae bacterium]